MPLATAHPSLTRHAAAQRRAMRGVAALEFAWVLPVLLLLLGGAWDLGQALHHHEVLTQAVRAAARHLSTGVPSDPTRQQEARQLAVTGRTDGAGPPLVPGLTVAHVVILEPEADAGVRKVATPQGPVSMVSVSVQNLTWTPQILPWPQAIPLRTVSATMTHSFF